MSWGKAVETDSNAIRIHWRRKTGALNADPEGSGAEKGWREAGGRSCWSAEEGGKGFEKIGGRGDAKAGAFGDGGGEVFGVVG
jgi:hypothetical protein